MLVCNEGMKIKPTPWQWNLYHVSNILFIHCLSFVEPVRMQANNKEKETKKQKNHNSDNRKFMAIMIMKWHFIVHLNVKIKKQLLEL